MTAARITPSGLNAVTAQLSERDHLVLRSVGQHRYLTTRHLQQLHFADRSTPIAASRACIRALTRLNSLNVLNRLERRVGGVRAGSASYVWTLGPVGDRLLRAADGEGTRTRFHEPGLTFLDHTLAVADTHLALIAAHRSAQIELVSVQLEPDCWRPYTSPAGSAEVVRPDLYVVTGAGEFEECQFLEVDRATESIPRIVRTCRAYQTYQDAGIEQATTGTFPRVIWIVPTPSRQATIAAAIRAARGLDTDLFAVITPDQLIESLDGDHIR